MGGLLVIYKMYHTKIQPLNGQQFLLSSHTITCIKMVPLKTPVISANDLTSEKIHKLITLIPGCMNIIFVCLFNLGIFLLRYAHLLIIGTHRKTEHPHTYCTTVGFLLINTQTSSLII